MIQPQPNDVDGNNYVIGKEKSQIKYMQKADGKKSQTKTNMRNRYIRGSIYN